MLSFTLKDKKSALPERPRILVTGAAGRIGSYFVKESGDRYDLRIFVHTLDEEAKALGKFGELMHGDLSGVTKCFGEALGRYFSTQKAMPFIALRIGAFQPSATPSEGGPVSNADGFVSRRDLQQLIELCLRDEKLQFAIFQALSANTFNRMDISDATELLGYTPRDDFFENHPELRATGLSSEVRAHNLSDK